MRKNGDKYLNVNKSNINTDNTRYLDSGNINSYHNRNNSNHLPKLNKEFHIENENYNLSYEGYRNLIFKKKMENNQSANEKESQELKESFIQNSSNNNSKLLTSVNISTPKFNFKGELINKNIFNNNIKDSKQYTKLIKEIKEAPKFKLNFQTSNLNSNKTIVYKSLNNTRLDNEERNYRLSTLPDKSIEDKDNDIIINKSLNFNPHSNLNSNYKISIKDKYNESPFKSLRLNPSRLNEYKSLNFNNPINNKGNNVNSDLLGNDTNIINNKINDSSIKLDTKVYNRLFKLQLIENEIEKQGCTTAFSRKNQEDFNRYCIEYLKSLKDEIVDVNLKVNKIRSNNRLQIFLLDSFTLNQKKEENETKALICNYQNDKRRINEVMMDYQNFKINRDNKDNKDKNVGLNTSIINDIKTKNSDLVSHYDKSISNYKFDNTIEYCNKETGTIKANTNPDNSENNNNYINELNTYYNNSNFNSHFNSNNNILIESDKYISKEDLTVLKQQFSSQIKSDIKEYTKKMLDEKNKQELDKINLEKNRSNNVLKNKILPFHISINLKKENNTNFFKPIGYLTICSSVATTLRSIKREVCNKKSKNSNKNGLITNIKNTNNDGSDNDNDFDSFNINTNDEEREKYVEVNYTLYNSKADLYGSADDAHRFYLYIRSLGEQYVEQGRISFSNKQVDCKPKNEFLSILRNFFNSSINEASLLYYSGHCTKEGKLLFETYEGPYYIDYYEFISCWRNRTFPKKNKHLTMILDCCYSGIWVNLLLANGDYNDVSIQASSRFDQQSYDCGSGKGSLFTNVLLNSNQLKRKELDEIRNNIMMQKQIPISVGLKDILYYEYAFEFILMNNWEEFLRMIPTTTYYKPLSTFIDKYEDYLLELETTLRSYLFIKEAISSKADTNNDYDNCKSKSKNNIKERNCKPLPNKTFILEIKNSPDIRLEITPMKSFKLMDSGFNNFIFFINNGVFTGQIEYNDDNFKYVLMFKLKNGNFQNKNGRAAIWQPDGFDSNYYGKYINNYITNEWCVFNIEEKNISAIIEQITRMISNLIKAYIEALNNKNINIEEKNIKIKSENKQDKEASLMLKLNNKKSKDENVEKKVKRSSVTFYYSDNSKIANNIKTNAEYVYSKLDRIKDIMFLLELITKTDESNLIYHNKLDEADNSSIGELSDYDIDDQELIENDKKFFTNKLYKNSFSNSEFPFSNIEAGQFLLNKLNNIEKTGLTEITLISKYFKDCDIFSFIKKNSKDLKKLTLEYNSLREIREISNNINNTNNNSNEINNSIDITNINTELYNSIINKSINTANEVYSIDNNKITKLKITDSNIQIFFKNLILSNIISNLDYLFLKMTFTNINEIALFEKGLEDCKVSELNLDINITDELLAKYKDDSPFKPIPLISTLKKFSLKLNFKRIDNTWFNDLLKIFQNSKLNSFILDDIDFMLKQILLIIQASNQVQYLQTFGLRNCNLHFVFNNYIKLNINYDISTNSSNNSNTNTKSLEPDRSKVRSSIHKVTNKLSNKNLLMINDYNKLSQSPIKLRRSRDQIYINSDLNSITENNNSFNINIYKNKLIFNKNITTLDLSNNRINNTGLDLIFQVLHNSKLRFNYHLILKDNLINDFSFNKFKQFYLGLAQTIDYGSNNNKIKLKDINKLEYFNNTNCENINLQGNLLTEKFNIKYLKSFSFNSLLSISEINISNIYLSEVDRFVKIISNKHTLKTLKVINCKLHNEKLIKIMEIVKFSYHNSINYLDVSYNTIFKTDTNSFNLMLAYIRFNKKLETLIMNNCVNLLELKVNKEKNSPEKIYLDNIFHCLTLKKLSIKNWKLRVNLNDIKILNDKYNIYYHSPLMKETEIHIKEAFFKLSIKALVSSNISDLNISNSSIKVVEEQIKDNVSLNINNDIKKQESFIFEEEAVLDNIITSDDTNNFITDNKGVEISSNIETLIINPEQLHTTFSNTKDLKLILNKHIKKKTMLNLLRNFNVIENLTIIDKINTENTYIKDIIANLNPKYNQVVNINTEKKKNDSKMNFKLEKNKNLEKIEIKKQSNIEYSNTIADLNLLSSKTKMKENLKDNMNLSILNNEVNEFKQPLKSILKTIPEISVSNNANNDLLNNIKLIKSPQVKPIIKANDNKNSIKTMYLNKFEKINVETLIIRNVSIFTMNEIFPYIARNKNLKEVINQNKNEILSLYENTDINSNLSFLKDKYFRFYLNDQDIPEDYLDEKLGTESDNEETDLNFSQEDDEIRDNQYKFKRFKKVSFSVKDYLSNDLHRYSSFNKLSRFKSQELTSHSLRKPSNLESIKETNVEGSNKEISDDNNMLKDLKSNTMNLKIKTMKSQELINSNNLERIESEEIDDKEILNRRKNNKEIENINNINNIDNIEEKDSHVTIIENENNSNKNYAWLSHNHSHSHSDENDLGFSKGETSIDLTKISEVAIKNSDFKYLKISYEMLLYITTNNIVLCKKQFFYPNKNTIFDIIPKETKYLKIFGNKIKKIYISEERVSPIEALELECVDLKSILEEVEKLLIKNKEEVEYNDLSENKNKDSKDINIYKKKFVPMFKLKSLIIKSTSIKDNCLISLYNIIDKYLKDSLIDLQLVNTYLKGYKFKQLTRVLANITSLNLSFNYISDQVFIDSLISLLKIGKIENLNLSYCGLNSFYLGILMNTLISTNIKETNETKSKKITEILTLNKASFSEVNENLRHNNKKKSLKQVSTLPRKNKSEKNIISKAQKRIQLKSLNISGFEISSLSNFIDLKNTENSDNNVSLLQDKKLLLKRKNTSGIQIEPLMLYQSNNALDYKDEVRKYFDNKIPDNLLIDSYNDTLKQNGLITSFISNFFYEIRSKKVIYGNSRDICLDHLKYTNAFTLDIESDVISNLSAMNNIVTNNNTNNSFNSNERKNSNNNNNESKYELTINNDFTNLSKSDNRNITNNADVDKNNFEVKKECSLFITNNTNLTNLIIENKITTLVLVQVDLEKVKNKLHKVLRKTSNNALSKLDKFIFIQCYKETSLLQTIFQLLFYFKSVTKLIIRGCILSYINLLNLEKILSLFKDSLVELDLNENQITDFSFQSLFNIFSNIKSSRIRKISFCHNMLTQNSLLSIINSNFYLSNITKQNITMNFINSFCAEKELSYITSLFANNYVPNFSLTDLEKCIKEKRKIVYTCVNCNNFIGKKLNNSIPLCLFCIKNSLVNMYLVYLYHSYICFAHYYTNSCADINDIRISSEKIDSNDNDIDIGNNISNKNSSVERNNVKSPMITQSLSLISKELDYLYSGYDNQINDYFDKKDFTVNIVGKEDNEINTKKNKIIFNTNNTINTFNNNNLIKISSDNINSKDLNTLIKFFDFNKTVSLVTNNKLEINDYNIEKLYKLNINRASTTTHSNLFKSKTFKSQEDFYNSK